MRRLLVLLAVLFSPALACGQPSGGLPPVYDPANQALRVNVVVGGGTGGTSSTFGGSFPGPGTAAGFKDSGGTLMQPGNLDASGNIKINCAAGCSGAADTTASGSITAVSQSVQITLAGDQGAGVVLTGNGASFTLTPQLSMDNTNWINTVFYDPVSRTTVATTSANGSLTIVTSGGAGFARVLSTAGPTSGTITVNLRATATGGSTPAPATTPVTQSGTWTVQPGNTANTTPWLTTIQQGGNAATVTGSNALKVDGSAVTQPISGTITANIGTQGGLATEGTLAKLTQTQGSTTSGQSGPLVQGAVTASVPSYAAGQTSPISIDPAGGLRVTCITGCSTAQDTTINSTVLSGVNQTITIPLAGQLGAAFQLQSGGTLVSTVQPQCSFDGGTAFQNAYVQDPVTGVVNSAPATTSGQATTNYILTCPGGASHGQLKVSSYTSGSATFLARATTITWPGLIWAPVTSSVPAYTAGQINTLSQTTGGALRTDASATTQPVNVTQIGGSGIATGTGTASASTQRVAVSSDSSLTANQGTPASGANAWPTTVTDTTNTIVKPGDAGNNAVRVNVVAGAAAGGTSSSFGSASPAAGTAAGARDTGGNMQPMQLDGAGVGQNLNVNCKVGCSAAGDTVGSSGTLNVAAATVSVALAGDNGSVLILTGAASPVLTLTPEVSPDGSTWFTAVFLDPVSGAMSATLSNPANGQWQIGYVGAQRNARVRVSAYTSGSITGQMFATVTRPWVMNFGSDGTNMRPIATTSGGVTKVDGTGGTFPVSGNLGANQSVNVNQLAGTTTDTNSGNKSAGTLRVVIATDQPQLTNKLLVTPDANSAVNVAQVNGVTVSTGVGAAGTGTARVVDVASGSTGSAVPTQASYLGANGSGNLTGIVACDNWTAINQTTGTQIITGTSAKKTYICSINLVSATAQNVALVGGTGSVCATSTHAIAGGTTAATGWNLAANGGLAQGSGLGVIMQAGTAADNLCILQSGSGQISGTIAWTQF